MAPLSTLGVGFVVLAAGLASCGTHTNTPTTPTVPPVISATPWSDEFDGPASASPDPAKWTYDLGGGGWGNQELETYTRLPENVHLDGQGHLVIHVESTPAGYTSSRLRTQGLFAAQYGRVEARIKLPAGQGLWPAFWMLGNSFNGGNWPQCGEIDIMENIGREPARVHGSVHGPGYSGGHAVTAVFVSPSGQPLADDFHVFAIQWAPKSITFSVDSTAYEVVTPASLPAGAAWVFDAPFFLVLNVAVGGSFPGAPDSTTQFPQEMLVDYVRYVPSAATTGTDARSAFTSRDPFLDIRVDPTRNEVVQRDP